MTALPTSTTVRILPYYSLAQGPANCQVKGFLLHHREVKESLERMFDVLPVFAGPCADWHYFEMGGAHFFRV